ncbi:MAG TPA: DUF2520 domain-containing protein [bacterium]|nr:DUF2520 domain-containing protein [bacterium]HPR89479.1 DUF2520 domain-containing protein [bacterium]
MDEHILLIGAGRAGGSLAQALHHAGCPVALVLDADRQAAARVAALCGAAAGVLPGPATGAPANHRASPSAGAESGLGRGRIWSLLFLTVPDDAIAPLAAQLAGDPAWPGAAIAVHCSGALPAAALAPLQPRARIASMHPLQSFSGRPDGWRNWSGIHVALEGEAEALDRLDALVRRLGSQPFRMTAAQKPLYHAAGAVLANGLVALGDAALQLVADLPLTQAEKRGLFAPLVQTTLATLLAAGPAAALTGPISRGDTGTVASHLHALREHQPGLVALYCALSLELLHLAEQEGRLTALQKERLIQLLTEQR